MDKDYFQVDKDTNPRGSKISEQEVQQIVKDLVTFQTKFLSLPSGCASPKETYPFTLKALLKQVNGSLYILENFQLLSQEKIDPVIQDSSIYGHWNPQFIPLASNEEAFLVVHGEKVVEWNRDEGVVEVRGENLEKLLEETRDACLKGKMEFIEGVGLVSSV